MNKEQFIKEFQGIAENLFLDRNEKKPEAKAKAWCELCLSSIDSGVFNHEEALRGMKRLLFSQKNFLIVGDLIAEIKKEKVLEVSQ